MIRTISSEDGTMHNLYRRNGVFCSAAEELRPPLKGDNTPGIIVLHEPIVADSLNELLLKIHARWNLAIEEVDPDALFVEEVS